MMAFKADIPAEKRAAILEQLESIQRDEQVRILFAIESGSRAWGFPSPDSDYDVRFVYVHTEDWYLSIEPGRDVIEKPLIDDWDVNGWDMKKAIGLLLKPNPVLLEWMSSPVHYLWDDTVVGALQDFADRHITPSSCIAHYFHLGQRQWERNIDGQDEINLKKYFYVLRPVLALRWVRMNPDRLPPMNFQKLVDGTGISTETQIQIAALLAKKSKASEVGLGNRISVLDEIIAAEFSWAADTGFPKLPVTEEIMAEANALFRRFVRGEVSHV